MANVDLEFDADVAVIGFGPVGATLAGLLGRRGISVIVIERESGVFSLPRAAHIDHTGLRALQEVGCVEELLAGMIPNVGTDLVSADRELLLRVPSARRAPTGFPASMYFYQPVFDSVLRRTVTELPTVTVELATEAVDISVDADRAVLTVKGADGMSRRLTARWVVGCDGASSFVRQQLEAAWQDFRFDKNWVIFDLLLREREPRPLRAIEVCDPRRPHTELPMPEGRYRFEFMLMEGEQPGDFLEPQVAFRTLLSGLVDEREAEVERMASYVFRGCVASAWHIGRAFLAGDAAHLMPPFLGQGMCCGIRDVANLAWKLSEVLKYRAPEALLDSYEAECKPNVEYVIQSAIGLGQLISAGTGSGSELDLAGVNETIRHSSYHFSLPSLPAGPLVLEGGGEIFLQPRDAKGLGSDEIVGQRFLLLTQTKDLDAPAINWWRGRDAYVTTPELLDPSGEVRSWMSARGASVVVVRPDRYVLAAGRDLGAITDAVVSQLDPEGGLI